MFSEVQQGMANDVWPSLSEVYFPKSPQSNFMENGTGAHGTREYPE